MRDGGKLRKQYISPNISPCGSMKDSYGREISSLRVSITQRCNLNCFYCHREGELRPGREMSPGEIGRLVRVASDLGMRKLKLTGGEPLMREDITSVVEECAPHMEEVSLTTNGILLDRKAEELGTAGLDRVNVSLDAPEKETYRRIVGVDAFSQVISGIQAAVDHGLGPVKLNMVVMRGLNDHLVEEGIEFAREHDCILQLIELETTRDRVNDGFYAKYHYDMGDLERELTSRAERVTPREMHHRIKYLLPPEVEVVRPMHNTAFCANCHRLRVTSEGRIRPCLLSQDGTEDALTPMREGCDDRTLRELFERVISNRRPYWL